MKTQATIVCNTLEDSLYADAELERISCFIDVQMQFFGNVQDRNEDDTK